MKPRTPQYILTIAGKDVTADVAGYLKTLTYVDKTRNETDELTILLEDTDGLWMGPWYPQKGDTLTASIGYDDALVPCGEFTIDEIEHTGSKSGGDEVLIRGLAAGVTKAVRTKRSTGFEKQTLRQIAEAVASRNGLTVEGTIAGIRIDRSTQNRETDLSYLRRVAEQFGHYFSVRGTKLVFTSVFELQDGEPVLTIGRGDVTRFRFQDKVTETYSGAQVKFRNPADNKAIDQALRESGLNFSVDELQLRGKAENNQQAERMAKAALNDKNSKQRTGDITMPGEPLALAGNNILVVGLGESSGKYHIETSTHTITRGNGYDTQLSIKKVGDVSDDQKLPQGGAGAVKPEVQQQ